MVSEGVRPFGPTALVTMMKCRLNGGGLCPRHESSDSPGFCVPRMAIVPTYSALSRAQGGVRGRGGWKWLTSLHLSPDLQLICQPWEDKHVFYTPDLLLSEGRSLLSCLTKSHLWRRACVTCAYSCVQLFIVVKKTGALVFKHVVANMWWWKYSSCVNLKELF